MHPPEDPLRPVPKCAQICQFLYSKLPSRIKVSEIWVWGPFLQLRQPQSAVRKMRGGEEQLTVQLRTLHGFSQNEQHKKEYTFTFYLPCHIKRSAH